MGIFELKKLPYKRADGYEWSARFILGAGNMKYFEPFTIEIGRSESEYDTKSKSWLIKDKDVWRFEKLLKEANKPAIKSSREKPEPPRPKASPNEKIKKHLSGLVRNNHKKVTGYDHVGDGLKLPPYDYQREIIKFCVDTKEALIVAPCGAGKTSILLGIFDELIKSNEIKPPALIIVKASLKTQWAAETKKFTDYKPSIIKTFKACTQKESAALKRLRQKEMSPGQIAKAENAIEDKFMSQFDADILITNYETLLDGSVRSALHKINPQFVASDEIHYIKDSGTKRSKYLCEFNNAPVRIGATATPVKRDPQDLFGIYKFIKPDLFPKKSTFGALYVKWGGYGRVIGSRNEKQLNEKISPYMIMKTKEEISSQLPTLIVTQRYCDLDEKQAEMNDQLMSELDELHEKEKKIFAKYKNNEKLAKSDPEFMEIEANIMARQTFAQELADSEELLKNSDSEMAKHYVTKSKANNKLDLLVDLIAEIIESGEKVCVFSRYARMQDVITERLRGEKDLKDIKIAYVNGSLSDEKRYKEVYNKFTDDDDYKILLMSDAGAEGINLSKCQYMIEYEPAESYAVQTQRHGRIERADSTHSNVFVYQLIANNSYDEIGQKIVAKKEKYDSQIVKGDI